MSNMVSNKNLALIAKDGESSNVEFKENLTAGIDREIVAFANSVGGSIYLGITDDGVITGITINNKIKSSVVDIARNCDPSIKISQVVYLEEKVLEIIVAEGTDKPYRCKDGFFVRIGPSSQKLKRDEIVELIVNNNKIHFDETTNTIFKYPEDLDIEALTNYLKLINITEKFKRQDILINLGAAINGDKSGKLQFTNAGILFFSKNPQKFFREGYVTAVLYSTTDRFSIIDKQDFTGGLIQQIEQSLSFIIRNMRVAMDITDNREKFSAIRKNIYDYPLIALREAIVNAVTHRDYNYDGSHIYIHMYPDRIEIESPGGLYRGLSEKDLGKRSVRRNRLIADFLHRAGYIERVGSGFSRMQHALQENNNPGYALAITNFFNIKFYPRINNSNIKGIELSKRQINLYNIFQERKTLSKSDVAAALRISDDTAMRELKKLIQLGMIKSHGHGKATIYVANSLWNSN